MFEHFLTWQLETDYWPGNPLCRNICWYVSTKSRADCSTQMTLLCERSGQGSPASNWLQSNSWSLKTRCLPAGSPRRQMYFSCPLNCFGWSFALIIISRCSLITIASYWLWTSIVIVEVFLCFSGPWTQGFTAGWFSRAGYLLLQARTFTVNKNLRTTFQEAKKGQILAVDHCMRWHLCWQAFMAFSERYTWIEAYTSCWYL